MISATIFKTLDTEERKLWHSHVFEVKSGMLIMPGPQGLPTGIWEEAETKEMEDVVGLYGKTYHFWQVDRGDKLPLGQPQLMMSFTHEDQFSGFKGKLEERDKQYGVNSQGKKGKRQYIAEPEIHEGRSCCSCGRSGIQLIESLQMQTMYGKRQKHKKVRNRNKIGHADSNPILLLNGHNIVVLLISLVPGAMIRQFLD